MHNLFIDDENFSRIQYLMQGKDSKHPGWRLFFSMLRDRGFRWEFFN